jgi:hypothetical protein
MTVTPFQPALPTEVQFTDAEFAFMEDSPPKLFPENQDSNLGLLRKIFCDRLQELANQQQTIYNERFVLTSQQFLDEWEIDTGLPVSPTNISIAQRRTNILSVLAKGAFTRARRREIVEKFITPTFGVPISLTPEGVALSPGGIPFFTEFTEITNLYNIVEDIQHFQYKVFLRNDFTPDMVGLIRELTRITPAHLSFTIEQVADPFNVNPVFPNYFTLDIARETDTSRGMGEIFSFHKATTTNQPEPITHH